MTEEDEIRKLSAEIKESLKDFRGPCYTKIKFDATLTDYQFTMILKMIELLKDFCFSADSLEEYWSLYQLPMPVSPATFPLLLDAINNHTRLCIQDGKAKRYIDYFNHRHYVPSLIMNDCIRSVDKTIADYRALVNKNSDEIEKFSQSLAQNMISINSNVFQFYLNNAFERNEEPTLEQSSMFYPNRRFLRNARDLRNDVSNVIQAERLNLSIFPKDAVTALNAHLLLERNICAFAALCGLMLDAAAGTDKEYFKPLKEIETIIRLLFHDSELYRLEFPASPVDVSMPILSRGASAHTTIMKLYLIDENDKRIIVRVDLPHIRTPKFHLNVESPDTDRYEKLDHYEIEAESHDDSLNRVLDSLKESIDVQMPNLHIIADTDNKDEKLILQDMEKFITYRHMCLNYIVGKDYCNEKKKVAGYLRLADKSIENVLSEAARHYSV